MPSGIGIGSSFYTDCRETSQPSGAMDVPNQTCRKIREMFQDRRVTEESPFVENCSRPIYVHSVDTGEWSECCSKAKRPPPSPWGLKKLFKVVKRLTGNEPRYLDCRPLEARIHRYAWGLGGVGYPEYTCGFMKLCGEPDQVCLMPRTIGDETSSLKRAFMAIKHGKPGQILKPNATKLCLRVGKPDHPGLVGTRFHEVYYLADPEPLLPPDRKSVV